MNSTEVGLWTKINDFQLDKDGSEFSFSDRVARENGWSKSYTLRVIGEYRKFIFLCCVSDEGVTPSDPVDQVWHLHLTYTKSYWIEFCQETLGKQIHHNPTKGGKEEAKKFNSYYSRLKDIYRYHFDTEPPIDIWHTADVRFSDIDFQRVNLRNYWLVKKPRKRFFTILTLIVIGLIGLISIQASGGLVAIVAMILFGLGLAYVLNNDDGKGGSGCSGYTGGSGGSCSGHHSGDSGCSSGCSGCSSSGCSGCGGGGD